MRLLTLLLALLMTAGCSGCVSLPSHSQLRATALRLESFGGGVCGATATGPAELVTAAHCIDTPLVAIDGASADVLKVERIGSDVARVTLKAARFQHWAKTGPRPLEGSRVCWWGAGGGTGDGLPRGLRRARLDDGNAGGRQRVLWRLRERVVFRGRPAGRGHVCDQGMAEERHRVQRDGGGAGSMKLHRGDGLPDTHCRKAGLREKQKGQPLEAGPSAFAGMERPMNAVIDRRPENWLNDAELASVRERIGRPTLALKSDLFSKLGL